MITNSATRKKNNLAIDRIRVDVNRRYRELMQTDGCATTIKLKTSYLRIGIKKKTLLKLVEQYNTKFEKRVGYSRAQGIFARYRTVASTFRSFSIYTNISNRKRQDTYLQIFKKDIDKPNKLKPFINRKNIFDWSKQKYQELRPFARAHIKPPTKPETN
ncbi:hypothetical protein [Bacteroides ihuae]|uniref:hypothetical protein n=1 Tax=Bacteroides ihuae TaxID=1852362 RepID=UPI0008D9C98D